MPMPTPPGPGEEPTNEGELYRYHFKRLITWYLEALDPLATRGLHLDAARARREQPLRDLLPCHRLGGVVDAELRGRWADRAQPRR